MDNLEVGLYRYLVTINAVACALVLYQHLILGLRPTKTTPRPAVHMIWACRIIPFIQLPISLVRAYISLSPDFSLRNPEYAYLDFVWSPMLTVVMIWLMQLYLAKRCCRISKLVTPNEVYATIRFVPIVIAVTLGIVSSAIGWQFIQHVGRGIDMLIRFFAFGAILMALVETAIVRFIERGSVCLTNYSWLWLVGTWLYFIPKV